MTVFQISTQNLAAPRNNKGEFIFYGYIKAKDFIKNCFGSY